MVLLPLLLIWLRDPMYFNAPARWAVVLLAVSAAVVAPQTLCEPPAGSSSAAMAAESNPQSEPTSASLNPASSSPAMHGPSSQNAPSSSAAAENGRSRVAGDRTAIPSQARLREGTRVPPTLGRFTQVEGGWLFQSEEPATEAPSTLDPQPDTATDSRESKAYQLRVLENLTLQRVAQVILQDSADNRWLVSGIVTEYFGENRLIISAAIRAGGSIEALP